MRNEMALVLAWGGAGHALLLALLFWLINVPESNVLMLTLSLALGLAALTVATVVESTASAWIVSRLGFRHALRRGVGAFLPFLVAVTVFAGCWWTAARLDALHLERAGEIDAWMIARFDAVRLSWLHRTIAAAAFVLRWVVGLGLAWAVLAAWARHGLPGVVRLRWVRAGLAPQALALTALAVVLFFALPWQAAWWRPRRISPTWVEPAFAAAKLGVLYVIAHAGWLLTIVASAGTPSGGTSVNEPRASRPPA